MWSGLPTARVSLAQFNIIGRSRTYTSPSNKIRSLRRLISHLKKISSMKPLLTISSQLPLSIPLVKPCLNLGFSEPTILEFRPNLPKPKYHPYIVEAIRLMYSKSPEELTPDEWEQFKDYHKWKKEKCEPIEEDLVYKPRTS